MLVREIGRRSRRRPGLRLGPLDAACDRRTIAICVLVFVSGALGGGGRGLGVLNVFVPLYLSLVLGIDATTVALMYTALVVCSVPGPIVAGWLSDRFGRKPLILAAYIGGAASLATVRARRHEPDDAVDHDRASWASSTSSRARSSRRCCPTCRRPRWRDAAFAAYFTLAFGVGALWIALYGWVIAVFGEEAGLPITFLLMAVAFIAAALTVLPIHLHDQPPAASVNKAFTRPR